jgi:CHAT domain-containing protein/Tfp pilus assembly protein PilF
MLFGQFAVAQPVQCLVADQRPHPRIQPAQRLVEQSAELDQIARLQIFHHTEGRRLFRAVRRHLIETDRPAGAPLGGVQMAALRNGAARGDGDDKGPQPVPGIDLSHPSHHFTEGLDGDILRLGRGQSGGRMAGAVECDGIEHAEGLFPRLAIPLSHIRQPRIAHNEASLTQPAREASQERGIFGQPSGFCINRLPGGAALTTLKTARMNRAAFLFLLLCSASGLAAAADPFEKAVSLLDDKQTDDALAEGEQTLAAREKELGPASQDLVPSVDALASLYLRAHRFERAEALRNQAVAIRRGLAPDNPLLADALFNLGWFDLNMGRYDASQAAFDECLTIRTRRYGHEHSSVAEVLNGQAVLQQNRGHYREAEALFLEAIRLNRSILGARSLRIATNLNNLATLYWSAGDYAQAERYFSEALELRDDLLGPANLQTMTTRNNLALLRLSMGDYAGAERLFRRVLKARELKLGPDNPLTLTTVHQLGLVYAYQDRFAEAEPLLRRSAEGRELRIGADQPDTARSFFHLAWLYDSMGRLAEAEPLHLRALEIREKVLGTDHPETAGSHAYLGRHYHLAGNLPEAEKQYLLALESQRRLLGPTHPDTLKTLDYLALLRIDQGRPEEAKALGREAAETRVTLLKGTFAFAPEAQRLSFQKTLSPYDLAASLNDAPALADTVFRMKGIVLDSLIEDDLLADMSPDGETRELVQRLRRLSEEPAQSGPDENQSEEAMRLQSRLSEKLAGYARQRKTLDLRAGQIIAALPDGSTLVEFIRFEKYRGLLQSYPHYGALIVRKDAAPVFTDLGSIGEINPVIDRYQRFVRNRVYDEALAGVLRALYAKLWEPLQAHLGTGEVLLAPDDRLNQISFATLLDPADKFLIETRCLRYVGSGRDLLRPVTGAPSKELVIVAAPAFKSGGTASPEAADLLPSLPGTTKEAGIVEAAGRETGWHVTLLTGQAATEQALHAIASPGILHIATHGFYLPEKADEPVRGNPMQRSALAFAGSQGTFEAWKSGLIADPAADNMLTAQEAGGLRLTGTRLVVLSACDTGLGDNAAGEGVLGLRRGFLRAGARQVLMTLWPVPDAETAEFMSRFYARSFPRLDTEAALCEVQRARLTELRTSRGLSVAVRQAGAFVLFE